MQNRPLKVLLISNIYTYEGNWDKLDELGARLQRDGRGELAVITPAAWPVPELRTVMQVPEKPSGSPWRQYRLDTIMEGQGNPFRYFFKPAELIATLKEYQPDLLHVEQEPESLSLLQLSLLKAWFKYRLIFVAWEDLNPLRLGWGFRKVNYSLADAGVAGNQAALARARGFGYHKRMEVIPQYGFSITCPGHPAARPRSNASGKFSIGYAGRLVPEKGLRSLVEAARAVPNAEIVMAGDGPMLDELTAAPHVRVLGWLPRTEMDRLWSQIDVLVLPTLTTGRKSAEQFGRVLVEAMAAGVPVIGSDAGAIPETIGDAGLVFPEGDVAILAATLNDLAADPSRRLALAERGLQRVKDHYTHDVLMGRTLALYDDVMGRKRTRGESAGWQTAGEAERIKRDVIGNGRGDEVERAA